MAYEKLTDDDILHIYELTQHKAKLLAEARTLTNEKIAGKFEVCPETVCRIATCRHAGIRRILNKKPAAL